MNKRRNFLKFASLATLGVVSGGSVLARPSIKRFGAGVPRLYNMRGKGKLIKISLAQWSLNNTFFDGKLDHLDFAKTAKDLDIHAIEYVNQFFKDKAEDISYLDEMNMRANDIDVKQLLIMIDGEGNLGGLNENDRMTAVENHYKWVDAAKYLGCHSIRVNAYGEGTEEEVSDAAIDGLGRLSEYAAKEEINVIVENHGSYSSKGSWLANVMKQVNMENCGTLPDFGNFCIKREEGKRWGAPCVEEYDKYKGVDEMMTYAKAVSAKSNEFDINNREVNIDYKRMLQILHKHNYKGYVGIEYEGDSLSEIDGIIATKKLLERTARNIMASSADRDRKLGRGKGKGQAKHKAKGVQRKKRKK